MDITGSFTLAKDLGIISVSGAFTKDAVSAADLAVNAKQQYSHTATFTASRNWTGNTSSNGNHTHTVTVNVNKNTSIYGNSTTVQPASLKVRVKTKAK